MFSDWVFIRSSGGVGVGCSDEVRVGVTGGVVDVEVFKPLPLTREAARRVFVFASMLEAT